MAKRIIGRADKASFPLINLYDVSLKVDTGAYTSAIHCSEIEMRNNFLYCRFFTEGDEASSSEEYVFDAYEVKVVKSSNGIAEPRYCISTEIELFGQTQPIALTLTARDEMKHPVLIGRRFLKNKFIVDTSKTDLSHKLKNK